MNMADSLRLSHVYRLNRTALENFARALPPPLTPPRKGEGEACGTTEIELPLLLPPFFDLFHQPAPGF